MNKTAFVETNGFFYRNRYWLLSALASVPIYIVTHSYVNGIGIHEESVATAASACFLAGIFAGRSIARIWTHNRKTIPNIHTALLVVLIIACTSWLFFHADFPLQGRAAINFLLFFLPFVVISLALGMLIKIVRVIMQNQLHEAQTMAAHSKSELHLLQSQLSPHFLFNTLNNLYGLSITRHELVPPLLLRLSELLRYSVYEATEIYVPLKEELAYINNYIEFEKIRMGDRLALTTEFEDITSRDIRIAPMLLIVFIENAFKHAKNSAENRVFIQITLRTWGNVILFSVKNSHSKSPDDNAVTDKSSGFGLSSVNKRLILLYPGENQLTIEDEASFYHVMLQLKIK